MGMPAQQTDWTAEMARALPEDGNRYEVLDGELFVTPAPSWKHQGILPTSSQFSTRTLGSIAWVGCDGRPPTSSSRLDGSCNPTCLSCPTPAPVSRAVGET